MREVNWGWLIRLVHFNGARFFFILLLLHIGRGIYFGSFNLIVTWITGVIILILVISRAFLGYVLPWGQISFWGATVITNLFSTIPYIGDEIVKWIWGGFSISGPTLTRFFSLHFLIPFTIIPVLIIHLLFLHNSGSRNPLGVWKNLDKIPFHPYFSFKDLLGFFVFFIFLITIIFIFPWIFRDPENFSISNSFKTPIHIQPEWYFLFAYAILRSIPNKLGGVIALLISILILLILPYYNFKTISNIKFIPIRKFIYWIFVIIFLNLTWIGSQPIEPPYFLIGIVLTVLYFIFYLIIPWIILLQIKIINL